MTDFVYTPCYPITPMTRQYHELARKAEELTASGEYAAAEAFAVAATEEAERVEAKFAPALRAVFRRGRIEKMMAKLGK